MVQMVLLQSKLADGAPSLRLASSRVLSYRPLPLANPDCLTLPRTAATGYKSRLASFARRLLG